MDIKTLNGKLNNLACVLDVVSVAVNSRPADDDQLAQSLGGCMDFIATACGELYDEYERMESNG